MNAQQRRKWGRALVTDERFSNFAAELTAAIEAVADDERLRIV